MIICEYKDLIKYAPVLPFLENGLACIEKLREQDFPVGKYEFEGGFLMVQAGETKMFAADAYETHRNYIDVQYSIEGGEAAFFAPLSKLQPVKEYDPEGDIAFFSLNEEATKLVVRPGMCYIAFPEDGHMPCRCQDVPNAFKKIVMKLPAEQG